jgi:hypothetical protein
MFAALLQPLHFNHTSFHPHYMTLTLPESYSHDSKPWQTSIFLNLCFSSANNWISLLRQELLQATTELGNGNFANLPPFAQNNALMQRAQQQTQQFQQFQQQMQQLLRCDPDASRWVMGNARCCCWEYDQ